MTIREKIVDGIKIFDDLEMGGRERRVREGREGGGREEEKEGKGDRENDKK